MTVADNRHRLLTEWRNRVRAEYGSAGLAAQAAHWMIQVAFPEQLVEVALRIVGDELAHSRLSHDVVVAMGGKDEPMTLDIAATASHTAKEGVLASLVDSITRNFCLGETFAVPLFHAMRSTTTHPVAQVALDRILRDEAVHRAFGWDALDVLLAIDKAGVSQRISASLPVLLKWFKQAYGAGTQVIPLSCEERSVGLISAEEYAAIYQQCLDEQIRTRFNKRGIVV